MKNHIRGLLVLFILAVIFSVLMWFGVRNTDTSQFANELDSYSDMGSELYTLEQWNNVWSDMWDETIQCLAILSSGDMQLRRGGTTHQLAKDSLKLVRNQMNQSYMALQEQISEWDSDERNEGEKLLRDWEDDMKNLDDKLNALGIGGH